jgi:tetrahydromethanopterin S-methyltransferase subunit G
MGEASGLRQRQKEVKNKVDFVSEFMKQFGPEVSQHLGANLGLDESAANQLVPPVIPMIMGGRFGKKR